MSDLAKDRERYENAQASHEWRHQHWTKAVAVPMLQSLLADLQAGSPDTKLLAIRGLKPNGLETLWLCTEDGETYGPGYDISFPCPPLCG